MHIVSFTILHRSDLIVDIADMEIHTVRREESSFFSISLSLLSTAIFFSLSSSFDFDM